MKKTPIFAIIAALLCLILSCPARAEENPCVFTDEVALTFAEQPLWGKVEVIPLPNDTLMLRYLSLDTNGFANPPLNAPYNDRLEIVDMGGNSIWSTLFLHLSENEMEAGDYWVQFAVDPDRFTIEYYPDSEMNDYSLNMRTLSGDGIDYSMTSVHQSDDQIRYIETCYPFRAENYRLPDAQGNPRCSITYLPTGHKGSGVASNHIAV